MLVQSSRLHVQGSCWSGSVVGMLEVSGLAGMCQRRLVGFGNMQYSSHNPDLQVAQCTDHLICAIISLGLYTSLPCSCTPYSAIQWTLPHPIQGTLPYLCITFRGTIQLANTYFGVLFLQSQHLMGPCCGKHLYFPTAGFLFRALFFTLCCCRYSLWGPLLKASLH
jgi:hypothetical protein